MGSRAFPCSSVASLLTVVMTLTALVSWADRDGRTAHGHTGRVHQALGSRCDDTTEDSSQCGLLLGTPTWIGQPRWVMSPRGHKRSSSHFPQGGVRLSIALSVHSLRFGLCRRRTGVPISSHVYCLLADGNKAFPSYILLMFTRRVGACVAPNRTDVDE